MPGRMWKQTQLRGRWFNLPQPSVPMTLGIAERFNFDRSQGSHSLNIAITPASAQAGKFNSDDRNALLRNVQSRWFEPTALP